MKYLAIEQDTGVDGQAFSPELLRSEAFRAHELYLEGSIRELYFDENHYAVMVLECESREKAGAVLASLPLVSNGLIRFAIRELHPYTGFGRIIVDPGFGSVSC
ncbi:hypothetical protein SDC9_27631 [bioreactor metagenome]|uniref:Muconolactone isomerase domain-containing protein n=1 Tax=bioreactor metagenome TaxID=1076179 RepID=A0A644USD0_9ZZZZ|nr:hypothetical protein [Lentimicrobium sp.]MEA5111854.1 hypothetical protein [Lentimicrobium sp.]